MCALKGIHMCEVPRSSVSIVIMNILNSQILLFNIILLLNSIRASWSNSWFQGLWRKIQDKPWISGDARKYGSTKTKSIGTHQKDRGAKLKKLPMAWVRTNGITNDSSKSINPQSIWITAQIKKLFICSHWLMTD